MALVYGSQHERVCGVNNRIVSHSEGNVKSRSRFQTHSMAELDQLDLTVSYVFRDAMVEHVPMVIGARQKSLKTLIALDAAVSMAAGVPWLGHFDCDQPARVVYFCGEGGLVFARDALQRICRSKELDLADVYSLAVCDAVPNLATEGEVVEALAACRDHEADVAFFDPLYLMMGDAAAMASNVYGMGTLFQRLLRACHEQGVTPILLHHFRKGFDGAEPELTDLSQAGCAEFAGQWLLINRQRAYDEEIPGEHDLIIRLGSRTGHSSKWALHVSEGSTADRGGRYWRPEVQPMTALRERQEADKKARAEQLRREKLEEHMAAVTSSLAAYGDEGARKTELREDMNVSSATIGPVLAELVRTGRIERYQCGRYFKYRLAA